MYTISIGIYIAAEANLAIDVGGADKINNISKIEPTSLERKFHNL